MKKSIIFFCLFFMYSVYGDPTTKRPTLVTFSKFDKSLLSAVENNDIEGAKYFLEAGASIKVRDSLNQTPLYISVIEGYEDMVDFLLDRGANTEVKDDISGYTPLYWAVQKVHRSIVRRLLESGANPNSQNTLKQTPLHEAFRIGDIEIAKLLLLYGSDIGIQDYFHNTPLDYARNPNLVALRKFKPGKENDIFNVTFLDEIIYRCRQAFKEIRQPHHSY